jgi:hypothetical protein
LQDIRDRFGRVSGIQVARGAIAVAPGTADEGA